MALQVNLKKSIGPQGLADVKVLSKNVRVMFKDTGDVYEIALDNWDKKRASGEYLVTLNKTTDKVIGIRPPAGTYIVRFHQFGNRVDTIPQPKIQRGGVRQSKSGGTYMAPDKMVFNALLEVISEDRFNGLEILSILPYGFEPQSGTPFSTINVSGKTDLERIETFLRLAGFDFNKDIPFAPNVLPWLEEELKRAATVWMVTTNEDGFIASMAALPAHLAPKVKKSKK